MGIILVSLSQGMHQHILSFGYRTSWEMIEGIDKLILKSNQNQDYTNLTYLLSAKMGANKNVTDYVARLLPVFDQLELSLRNLLIVCGCGPITYWGYQYSPSMLIDPVTGQHNSAGIAAGATGNYYVKFPAFTVTNSFVFLPSLSQLLRLRLYLSEDGWELHVYNSSSNASA